MVTDALYSGQHEGFKCGWHGALGVLALGACLYNAAAFLVRRERHLAVNTLIYLGLAVMEWRQVAHHRAATE